jgi:hypothetical protein
MLARQRPLCKGGGLNYKPFVSNQLRTDDRGLCPDFAVLELVFFTRVALLDTPLEVQRLTSPLGR